MAFTKMRCGNCGNDLATVSVEVAMDNRREIKAIAVTCKKCPVSTVFRIDACIRQDENSSKGDGSFCIGMDDPLEYYDDEEI